MPKPNAFVGLVADVMAAGEDLIRASSAAAERAPRGKLDRVIFADQDAELILPDTPRSARQRQILALLKKMHRHVYLETANKVITDVWIPLEGRVVRLAGLEDGTLLV